MVNPYKPDPDLLEQAIKEIHEEDEQNRIASREIWIWLENHEDLPYYEASAIGRFLRNNSEFGDIRITGTQGSITFSKYWEYEIIDQ